MTSAEFVAARLALGLTQAGLAKSLGVAARAVQYWESGERPVPQPVARIMRIADHEMLERLRAEE